MNNFLSNRGFYDQKFVKYDKYMTKCRAIESFMNWNLSLMISINLKFSWIESTIRNKFIIYELLMFKIDISMKRFFLNRKFL